MPILRVKEIRDTSHEDRLKRLSELRTELIRLKTMVKAGGALENPARIQELRKAIARILTIDSEPAPIKKKEEKKPKKEPEEKPKEKKKKPARKKKPKEAEEGKEQ